MLHASPPPGPTPGAESRFAPNPFQYNGRIALAVVPSLAVLLGAGGQTVSGTLCIGLMVTYILDALGMKEGAFAGVWVSLGGTILAFALSGAAFGGGVAARPIVLSALILLVGNFVGFVGGVWGSLQFRWLLIKHPPIVLSLERVLFAVAPIVATPIITWGIIAAVGIANASFYLTALLFGFYWVFSLPTPTSFRAKADKAYGGAIAEESLIGGALEGVIHTGLVLLLPPFFHLSVHYPQLLALNPLEIWNFLIVLSTPPLFIAYASTHNALWWLRLSPQTLHRARVIASSAALAVLIGALEARVVFHGFSQYIHLPPPLNYVLVTLALYGGAAAVGAHLAGATGKKGVNPTLVTAVLVAAALAGALVLGMPLQLLPIPAISAAYLGQFCRSRSLLSYAVYAAGGAACAAWFIVRHFWTIQAVLGDHSVKDTARVLMLGVILALALPGAAVAGGRGKVLLGALMVAQGLVVCVVEDRLYGHSHDEEGLYPGYLVALTSAVGWFMTHRLESDNRIGPWAGWFATCLYAAKLSLLVLVTPGVLWSSVLLAACVTPPILLYRDKARPQFRVKMKPWQAAFHAVTVTAAVWYFHYTLFDLLYAWSGVRPSDGALLGTIVVAAAGACAPIVAFHFTHMQAAKRTVVLAIAAGALLILLRPPLPPAWSVWWDEDHTPEHLRDEPTIYGHVAASGHAAGWPAWLLAGALISSVAAMTSAVPIQNRPLAAGGYALGLGAAVGVYLCAGFFYDTPLLHPLLFLASVAAAVFLVFAYHPTGKSAQYLPWLFALLAALLPVMYLLPQVSRFARPPDLDAASRLEEVALLEDARTSLVALYAALFLLIALVIKLKLTAILSASGHSQPALPSRQQGFAPSHRPFQPRRTSLAKALSVQKLSREGAWMPGLGNVATLLCFALCMLLNLEYTGGSDRSIFVLAPILLLLNQDANLFTTFTDRQRYFPVTLTITLYLVISSGYHIVVGALQGGLASSLLSLAGRHSVLIFTVKNALLLLVTIPNQVLFNTFMWDNVKQSSMVLVSLTPLNLPAMLLSDVSTVRVLGALGVAFALVQFLVSRRVRLAGLKYI